MKVISSKKDKVDFSDLKIGDCFLDEDGDLLIKTDTDQGGVQLSDGVLYNNLCGDMVTPVNAEVQIID